MTEHRKHHPEPIEGAPMDSAPTHEVGVVFLFSDYARKHRIHIEEIKPGFPDCIAYTISKGKRKKIRIEFEFKSKNFYAHKHDPDECDWIVCWEHNWPAAPENLTIVELRREYGLGFNVWIVPVNNEWKEELLESTEDYWSLPTQCHEDDLVLFYFTRPESYISEIWKASERSHFVEDAGWKDGSDVQGEIQKVCSLDDPIHLEDLRRNQFLKTSGFVRASMQGRHNASEHWPYLYDLIVRKNPKVKTKLSKYLKY
ncbi:MAG: hypothetical protein P9L94_17810 [Candidatus Hinthialibacter antarcticus]|nr:hypothetical protein [Candidatus Hinthialibacter antarcticus]